MDVHTALRSPSNSMYGVSLVGSLSLPNQASEDACSRALNTESEPPIVFLMVPVIHYAVSLIRLLGFHACNDPSSRLKRIAQQA